MAQSFSTPRSNSLAKGSTKRRRVLVTGAAGNIGSYFAQHSHRRYDMRLMVRRKADQQMLKKLAKWGEVVKAELSDLDLLKQYCEGIDTVVHMAANPSPNTEWESALNDNIIGTYNIFIAARSAGCRRVIYAS